MKAEIDAFWVGRDLGYRGGRRTGLALTDEINASAYARRWGLEFCRSTKGDACKERTASVIWDVLSRVPQPVFLWNVFPLHPYEVEHQFSNRAHNASERKVGEEILAVLESMLKPRRLIAVGNDAVSSISKLKDEDFCYKVRHPSYGGHVDFVEKMCELYSLDGLGKQSELF
ncbi:uracil-DNA glycosylase [Pseudomonas soli]|uniref:uracil-DNA glycosylase n=1 Tax=Pseudomonas soli TaxID=1306993 RepID=UPI0021ABCF16|nr:uracil-DNA glycosylase [Pseudomonas soli]